MSLATGEPFAGRRLDTALRRIAAPQ